MLDRDPASVLLDSAARRIVGRALRNPGRWQVTRLSDPGERARRYLAAIGVDWRGPDNASAQGGRGLNARDRWGRAFVRACYYQFRWFSVTGGGSWRDDPRSEARHAGALRVEVGRRVPALGVLPAGRAVRVMYDAGGEAKYRAVRRMPDSARIYDDTGVPSARWSDPARRDWQ